MTSNYEKTLDNVIKKYVKLCNYGLCNWETMINTTNMSKEIKDTFIEYSKSRSKLLGYVIKKHCDDCHLNISGSENIKSDLDVGLSINTQKRNINEDINNKQNNVSDIISKVQKHSKEEIEKMMKNIDKVIYEKTKKIKLFETNILNELFDINIYGHTFYFKSKVNLTTSLGKIHYYDFNKVLEIEKIFETQKKHAYFRVWESIISDINKSKTNLIPKRFLSWMRVKSFEVDMNIKDESMYLKKLKFVEKLISSNNKTILYETINSISDCDLYSVDSYCTYGAFMHVVVLRQLSQVTLKLPKECFQHSMIEHFAKIQTMFLKTKTNGIIDLDLLNVIKGSKYLMRFYDAILCYLYSSDHFYNKSMILDSKGIKLKLKFNLLNEICSKYRHEVKQHHSKTEIGSLIIHMIKKHFNLENFNLINFHEEVISDYLSFNTDFKSSMLY